MKIKKLLKEMLLVAAGLLVGTNVWGASQTKIVLYSEDYSEYSTNNETVSDWTVRQNGTAQFDKTGGYAKLNCNSEKNRGFLYTSFGISDAQWIDAASHGMTEYFVEFDFDYYHGYASNSQFVVTSANNPDLGNSAYTGNDRLFSFYTESSTANESPATLYMNQTSATGDKTMSITKEQACRYHVKLTVGTSSVAYAVTKRSDESSVVSGSYTLESGVSNKVTGMWVALGKYWSRMMIDNIEVYYMASPIGNFSLASTGDYYIKDGDATGKYIRTTYDFTSYTDGSDRGNKTPSGFTNSVKMYETTVVKESPKKDRPAGLTISNTNSNNGYLQYYSGIGMQVGSTASLKLAVTNATSNTVSYLYYKQGKESDQTTAELTDESDPITISGTDNEELPVKTTSYKLYTRLEVFTKDVPSTIGSTGYTTFASSYPLNIDGMTASTGTVKAYYVTASDMKSSSVALTEVTGTVAAETGLILNGTAGATITIPVVASGTDYTATNMLVGCTANTDITASTPNYGNFYVLSATEAAFKKIQSWVEASNTLTIPAGKAYLDTTGADVVGAPSLTFDFGGTTGIGATLVNNEKVNSEVYDLQGRKVMNPAKGLYIVNGKKIIIK